MSLRFVREILRAASALALGGALLCGLTATAVADEIWLWGESTPIEGEILDTKDGKVRIKKSDGAIVEVDRNQIKRIVSPEDNAEAAKEAAERAAAEAAERAKLLSRPVVPSRSRPAGGWLLFFAKEEAQKKDPRPNGYRHYKLVPSPQADGWILEMTDFMVDEHGKPRHYAVMAWRFDNELRSQSYRARLVAKGQRRADEDSTDEAQIGAGKIRLQTGPSGKVLPGAPDFDVPDDTEFMEVLLARFLHGDLLVSLLDSTESQLAPVVVPNRWLIFNGGKGPEGEAWPLTGRITCEYGKRPDKNVEGYSQFVVKVREEFPGTPMPATAMRMVFGYKPGEPVRILSIMQTRAPIGAMADINKVRQTTLMDSVPDKWRHVRMLEPPTPAFSRG